MDRFQAMQVFVRVVDANSFTRAADSLSLPRTTVTTIIQNLERLLGVRLLNRTTRRIGLTPDGAGYYQHCVRILADVEETEACFQEAALRLKGRLRIDVPTCIGRLILIPSLCDFHDKYPDVELVLGLGDRPVDMVQEAVDCVIRSGDLEDSSLVARRIGMLQTVTCASPSYISRHGMPQTIEELGRHHAVHYFMSRSGRNCAWNFKVDDKHQEVEMKGTVAVNEAGAYLDCGLKGFGLIQTPRYMALPHLQSGELIEVLPQWKPGAVPMSILYPQSRQLAQGARLRRLGGRAVRQLPAVERPRRDRSRRAHLRRLQERGGQGPVARAAARARPRHADRGPAGPAQRPRGSGGIRAVGGRWRRPA